uniref:Peroxisomal membrane protein 2 n=1 Tax=Kalanchoe fedtschenkoi TaxID=63787 RepID=A0A7N0SXX6_KALFE
MAAASVNTISSQSFLPLKPKPKPSASCLKFSSVKLPQPRTQFPHSKLRAEARLVANSVAEEFDVIPVQSGDVTDQQDALAAGARSESESERDGDREVGDLVGGFVEGRLSFETGGSGFGGGSVGSGDGDHDQEDVMRLIDRSINATIVLAAGSFAITKLLTIDSDYWHGWTIYEILRYAPQHNWVAYEEALKTNPVLAKMVISGIVYSVGDWIAQCFEGKPLFEFDRTRMFRSGLVGFTLHGSLSHYYYQFCEILFPFHDWWVVPVKVAFDQTIWSAIWNSIYFTLLGFLRLESPATIFSELKATFFPMLTAGWKLWPFAHLITYGVIPVEQRLLWVDCVELVWVTILATYSNEKSEARIADKPAEGSSLSAPEGNEVDTSVE